MTHVLSLLFIYTVWWRMRSLSYHYLPLFSELGRAFLTDFSQFFATFSPWHELRLQPSNFVCYHSVSFIIVPLCHPLCNSNASFIISTTCYSPPRTREEAAPKETQQVERQGQTNHPHRTSSGRQWAKTHTMPTRAKGRKYGADLQLRKTIFRLTGMFIYHLSTNHTYVCSKEESSLSLFTAFTQRSVAGPPAVAVVLSTLYYRRCIVAVILRTFHPFIVPTLFHRRFIFSLLYRRFIDTAIFILAAL